MRHEPTARTPRGVVAHHLLAVARTRETAQSYGTRAMRSHWYHDARFTLSLVRMMRQRLPARQLP